MNRLQNEQSAYLRHAAHQKIDWYPWSEAAFEKARAENKPVFLSSGAIWCHWCHVMAQESFENDEVAAILNELYVAVKLDRDERPDIDKRYQQAVAVMGRSGGWPLSVFLTADKKPFYGGTYFPPDDAYGRPGLKTILRTISDFYRTKREEVDESSEKFHAILKEQRPRAGRMSESLIAEAEKNILGSLDQEHGGFGQAPKFPMPGAMEFLLGRYFFTKDEHVEYAVKKTLLAMASGGFYDQLGGGFHRYSTDEAWGVPHFEKMADDNAWLLRNYADAYSIFGDEYFKKIAEGILYFTGTELSDPEGGFYASMDADVTPDDEGGYFTWTEEQMRSLLTEEEFAVLSLYFLDRRNAVHHDNGKMVLSVSMTAGEIADKRGMDADMVRAAIEVGRRKLLMEREKRQKPVIDKAIYTSLNGMMISSYFKAYRAFGDKAVEERAIKSLDRVLKTNMDGGMLLHCIGVEAFLDDYVHMIDALISAYEANGNKDYLDEARRLMSVCLDKFWDGTDGGFFDTGEEVLGLRLKGIDDVPRPSANGLAVILLLKLSALFGDDKYRTYAVEALNTFSSDAQLMGVHGAYYFCGLEAFFRMLKLDVCAKPESDLARPARALYYPYSSIHYGDDEGRITPCIGNTCYEPVRNMSELKTLLNLAARSGVSEE